jgi:predicted RNA-binding Zn ribbon-like protein
MNFDHYSDASVEVAVDLVNAFGTAPLAAAGHGDEPLADPVAFLRDHGLDATGVTQDDAAAVQRLADRLHTVFAADNAVVAVDAINLVLVAAGARPRITGHDGQDWHVHYDAASGTPLDKLAVTAAMGLATALCTGGTDRFGRCDGPACRDAYVDTSRNNRRRFCTDGCANRAHVSAHRARRRREAATE